MELAAEGDMAGELVRAKRGELERERACIRSELQAAGAAIPQTGAVAGAIRRALLDVSAVLAGDPAGAREALRAILGGEPLRVTAGAEGYRLEGALEVIPATPEEGPPVVQVAGARSVPGPALRVPIAWRLAA